MQNVLKVYNSLSGTKEDFIPHNPPYVGMYVCGPTVYSEVHLGNCRTFISFDTIYRYLMHLGFKVRYVRNITDAGHLEEDADDGEDKISKKARLEKIEPMEIVQRYSLDFHRVLTLFNTLSPNIEPTATGHIIEQINAIKQLIDNGLAYIVNGSVYFDVDAYNKNKGNYGQLSGRNIEELLSGSRELDGQSDKRNPFDFSLWKKASKEHIMRWDSPWSEGFPGWHLECSVMSTKYLGDEFDIHGGGMDLKFPHHECEIAQNKGINGKNPVKYWVHTNMLTLNDKRMSKSSGNSVLPLEIFSGNNHIFKKAFSPDVVKFFMLQAHYRGTLNMSNHALEAAEKGLLRMIEGNNNIASLPVSDTSTVDVSSIKNSCYNAMNDDFNTPVAIAKLFDGIKLINSINSGTETINNKDKENLVKLYDDFLFEIFGFHNSIIKEKTSDISSKLVELLIKMRHNAKQDGNYKLADDIRNDLSSIGVVLNDTKDGTNWVK